MPECREMTKVITASLDDKLSWRERLLMKLHLKACDPCTNFIEQIKFIRTSLGHSIDKAGQPDHSVVLSDNARSRMKQALETTGSSF